MAKDANDTHFRLAFPPTIAASVRSHMHNLNSHPAYQTLRKEQALLQRQGEAITGEALAGALWPIRHAGGLNTEYVSGITRFGTPCFLGPS